MFINSKKKEVKAIQGVKNFNSKEMKKKKKIFSINHVNHDFSEKDINERIRYREPAEDSKYLCCSFCFHEGKFKYSNLEHEFICVEMSQEQKKKFRRSDLQNSVLAALNYKRDVVIIIGLSKQLDIVGMNYSSQYKQQFERYFSVLIKQSIRPKINKQDQIFDIRFVPVLKKQTHEETGKCIITITVRREDKTSYFIEIQRKGYHTEYHFCHAKKYLTSIPLKVQQCKAEQIYRQAQQLFRCKGKNRGIHYRMECPKPRQFIELNKNIEQPLFQQINFAQLLNINKNPKTFSTLIKFHNRITFENSNALINIQKQLERLRQSFTIKQIKYQLKQVKLSNQEDKLFFIIMHDHHPQVVRNVISQENNGMAFQYSSLKTLMKLKDFKANADLDDLKKNDSFFLKEYRQYFKEGKLQRFYTISSKNIRKVYYKMNDEDDQSLPAILFTYIISDKLKLEPQFVDEKTISGPRYMLSIK